MSRYNRIVGEPQPGVYKMRLVKRGPWVPVRIWWRFGERDPDTGELISDDMLMAKVGDHDIAEAVDAWPGCHEISQNEYERLLSRGRYAAKHAPEMPEAKPREAINLKRMKPIW